MAHEKKVKQLKTTKPSLTNFIFLMTAGVLFAWSLVLGIANPTIFRLDYMVSFIKMFVIVGILGLIFSSKRTLWISIGLVAVLTIFVASGFFLTPEYPNLANRMAESLTNATAFITGYRPHTDLYEMIIVWMIFITVGLFVAIFSYLQPRFSMLFIGATIILGVAITSPYFSYTRSFYVFVFSILVFLIRDLHQRNAIHEVDPAPFTKYILALTAISLLIAGILPIPSEGFAEGFFQDFVQRPFNFVNNTITNITQSNEFSLRQVGFGGSGRLGGNVTLNDRLFMRVRTHSRNPIYLTGAVMDTYTGYSWNNRFNDEMPVDFNDIAQNLELLEYSLWWDLSHLERFSQIPVDRFVLLRPEDEFFDEWRYHGWYIDPELRIFFDEVTGETMWLHNERIEWDSSWMMDDGSVMTIDALNSRLLSAFLMGIVRDIVAYNDASDLSFLRDRDGRFLTNRRMPNHMRYLVRSFEPNHQYYGWTNIEGAEYFTLSDLASRSRLTRVNRGWLSNILDFITAFREFHGYNPATISNITHGSTTISFEAFLTDYLIPRADQIHEMYTTLPDEFPERVRELAHTATARATNDYDRMRLLERYLSRNFTYTLTPGPSPQHQDFVDHFLFEIRQGYCVHFATAFVTMARSLGMPARYVEGFRIDIGPNTPRNEGFIDVLNNMAHAWAEVYFEGSGWVRFEPTPSSGLPQAAPTPGGTGGAGFGGFDPEYPEQEPPGTGDIDFIPQPPGSGTEQVEEEVLSTSLWLLIAIGFVFALIVGRIIFVHIKIKGRKYKGNNEAVVHFFGTMLSYFKVFKFSMKADETARQFATRMCHEHFNDFYDEHLQSLLKETAEIFSKARYSNLMISNKERRVVEKLIQILDERMKHVGRWKYFCDHYIRIKH